MPDLWFIHLTNKNVKNCSSQFAAFWFGTSIVRPQARTNKTMWGSHFRQQSTSKANRCLKFTAVKLVFNSTRLLSIVTAFVEHPIRACTLHSSSSLLTFTTNAERNLFWLLLANGFVARSKMNVFRDKAHYLNSNNRHTNDCLSTTKKDRNPNYTIRWVVSRTTGIKDFKSSF